MFAAQDGQSGAIPPLSATLRAAGPSGLSLGISGRTDSGHLPGGQNLLRAAPFAAFGGLEGFCGFSPEPLCSHHPAAAPPAGISSQNLPECTWPGRERQNGHSQELSWWGMEKKV